MPKKLILTKIFEMNIHQTITTEPQIITKNKENYVLIPTENGELLSIDKKGNLNWKFDTKEETNEIEKLFVDTKTGHGINSKPLLTTTNDKTNIIFGNENGTVYSLTDNGELNWTYKTESAIRSSPTYKDKKIVIGSTDKYIYILDEQGKLIAKYITSEKIEASPILLKDEIIICTSEGNVINLSKNGTTNWTYKTKNKIISNPIIFNQNQIIVCSTDNNVYCLDLKGNLNWKFETKGSIYAEPEIGDIDEDKLTEIIIGSTDNNTYILSDKGIEKWNFATNFWVVAQPKIFEIDQKKYLAIPSYDGNIYIINGTGEYNYEYIPGISGIVMQESNFSEIPTKDPGKIQGKILYKENTGDLITGITIKNKYLAATTKKGKVILYEIKKT